MLLFSASFSLKLCAREKHENVLQNKNDFFLPYNVNYFIDKRR